MKTLVFLIALLFSINAVLGQAAGNWFYNQKKSSLPISSISLENNFDGYVQQSNQGYYNKSQSYFSDTIITLETKILMNAKADEYAIIFGVTQVGETIDNCQKMINERIDQFIGNIKSIGITNNDIYTDFISQVPIFEIEVEKKLFSKTYNEVPAGFEVKKNIHIRYKDSKTADKLLNIAAKNEIYDVIKVDYIIKDNSIIYNIIREKAIKNINNKKLDFEKLGINFTSFYKIVKEKKHSVFPIERYSQYKAFINSQKAKTSKKVIYKNPSQIDIFYNKYPYNNFDVVINPEMLSPSVQFLYTLKVKYILKANE